MIERCFVEVRRRTRPMVCFVNVESVDRIIYSIFQRFNLEWKTRTLSVFTRIMKGRPFELGSEYQPELFRKERPQWTVSSMSA